MSEVQQLERNVILRQTPAGERSRLQKHLHTVEFPFAKSVLEEGERAEYAYFPLRGGLLSLTRSDHRGTKVEVGMVGYEGVAGLAALLNPDQHVDSIVCQGEGTFLKMPARMFQEEFRRGEGYQRLILRYLNSVLTQISQSALCNRLHPLEQRAARWLLMTQDRVRRNSFEMTQEFLSYMFGTTIPRVNEAVQSLEKVGAIRHSRRKIEIIDTAVLEGMACDCYAVVREHFRNSLEH